MTENERQLICRLCGWAWKARVDRPAQCPRCKRYDYAPPRGTRGAQGCRMNIRQLVDATEGYAAHAPTAIVAEADAEACRQMTCGACGRVGLAFRPFLHGRGSSYSYRAFAVCEGCGLVIEF